MDIRKQVWGYDPRYLRCEPYVGDESLDFVYYERNPQAAERPSQPTVRRRSLVAGALAVFGVAFTKD